MTEEEKQALCDEIVENVQDYFDNYDWDKKFKEHFGEQKLITEQHLQLWRSPLAPRLHSLVFH